MTTIATTAAVVASYSYYYHCLAGSGMYCKQSADLSDTVRNYYLLYISPSLLLLYIFIILLKYNVWLN